MKKRIKMKRFDKKILLLLIITYSFEYNFEYNFE